MTPSEKAKAGVELLKEAIADLLAAHPDGLRHIDIVRLLDIPSDYRGKQKNYLSWSVVGLLINAKKIRRTGNLYYLARIPKV
jgi:hypothetical protein